MTYVIGPSCHGEKSAACVSVCPVDAIHPRPDEPGFATAEQLYIDPAACIDCYACQEECPVSAIRHESQVDVGWGNAIELNRAYFEQNSGGAL